VAQVGNVVLAIYDISEEPGVYVTNSLFFTHAWFPKSEFDEVIEEEGWVFARLGGGYLALRSQYPYHWQTEEGEDKDNEILVPGKRNVWIGELGRKAVDGDFSEFRRRICGAPIAFDNLAVTYDSPSQGRLEFAWEGDLLQNGNPVPLRDYPRYRNPYMEVAFPADEVTIRKADHFLELKWDTVTRRASGFLES
jgi:hypothetical protein